jgi:hypothetical protein
MKKNIIYVLGLLLVFTNCSKQLDELKPRTSLTIDIALKDEAGIKNAAIGVYGIVRRSGFYGGDVQMGADLLGGNLDIRWNGTFKGQLDVLTKDMVDNNELATATWIVAYEAINAANNVLENIGKITNVSEQNKIKGEMLFLRAICHFELVRLYAQPWNTTGTNNQLGVPIMLKPSNFERVSRATVAEVYTQVIADLTEAENLLPNNNSVFATKFTAKAFLARVFLQKSDFTQALAKANDVISNSGKTLNSDVTTVFATNNSNESLFEIQQTEANNAGIGNSGLFAFYANLPQGRGDVEILDEHLNLYGGTDKRRTDLFYQGTLANRAGKWASGKWKAYNKNYVIMRLAEMYLVRAECNFRLSSSTGATPLADINALRSRANASALTTVDLQKIKLERQLELCFEGHRIHDIKRFGDNVVSVTPAFNYPTNSPKLVYPIPFRERTANPNLEQNPGY